MDFQLQGQNDGLAAKADNLSLIPGTYMIERDNHRKYSCSYSMEPTHIHNEYESVKCLVSLLAFLSEVKYERLLTYRLGNHFHIKISFFWLFNYLEEIVCLSFGLHLFPELFGIFGMQLLHVSVFWLDVFSFFLSFDSFELDFLLFWNAH